jgi:hypothetical protein
MVLKIELFNSTSISVPVASLLDNGSRVHLNLDPASANLLAPTQRYTLIADNGDGLAHIRKGKIQSINKETSGVIVDL